jgi:TetR/AcrR family transcriptional regulator, transcriptional repressor of bet genes
MPRPSNTAERRTQIVDGLRHVLADKGYAGATIPDIARAARLAPGLVHYHFEDKRAVLLALVEDLAARLRVRVLERERHAVNARDRLLAFLDGAAALGPGADHDALACWVGVSAEAVRDRAVRGVVEDIAAQLVADLQTRVRDALREAGRPTRAARAHAALLWSTIQGSYVVATTTPDVIPRGSMAPALRRLALTLIEQEDA